MKILITLLMFSVIVPATWAEELVAEGTRGESNTATEATLYAPSRWEGTLKRAIRLTTAEGRRDG